MSLLTGHYPKTIHLGNTSPSHLRNAPMYTPHKLFITHALSSSPKGVRRMLSRSMATLLLLSYTKLRRIRVTIFSFSTCTLRYPSGAVDYVWLYDANVHFLKGKHIYPFIAGMLVLAWSPSFTLQLAFFQYLQACSGRRACRWGNKL